MPHRVRGIGAPLGRAVLDVFRSGTPWRPSVPRKTSRGAPPGRAPLPDSPARRQAAGAPSAWSTPPIHHSSDHADGATLGRWDAKASQRPRRPVTTESRSATVAETGAVAVSASEAVSVSDPDGHAATRGTPVVAGHECPAYSFIGHGHGHRHGCCHDTLTAAVTQPNPWPYSRPHPP